MSVQNVSLVIHEKKEKCIFKETGHCSLRFSSQCSQMNGIESHPDLLHLCPVLYSGKRSSPLSCLRTWSWGVEVCSPHCEGSRAAMQGSSRSSWRSTERSAHLLGTLWSPPSSCTSTSTRVTLCLIMGRNRHNKLFIRCFV